MAGLRKTGGRPKKMTDEKVQIAARLMADGQVPVQEIRETLGISRATLYRYLSPEGEIRK